MKKVLVDFKLQQDLNKSASIQETQAHFRPLLKPYQSLGLADRPTIVIDNGSFECRAGWSFEDIPFLRYRNIVAKPKTSVNKQIDSMHLVGDEINEFDAGKVHKRSMFDKNVVYHVQSLEHMLDYTFGHLGLAEDQAIEYPLLITEALCNPNYCRAQVSELLFECYSLQCVSYAIDSLLSFYYNLSHGKNFQINNSTGLIVSSSFQVSHIIPVFNGNVHLPHTKRLPLGGFHHNDLLVKSLSLKYPQHKNTLTSESVQQIQEGHTFCAKNYREQITFLEHIYQEERKQQAEEDKQRRQMLFGDEQNEEVVEEKEPVDLRARRIKVYKSRIAKMNEDQVEEDDLDKEDHIIQFPWQVEALPSEEEVKKRQDMRKEQGQKLKEIMQKKREQNKKQFQEELNDLESLEAYKDDIPALKEEIKQRGIATIDEYNKRIKKLREKLNIKVASKTEEEKYNLLDIADEFLSQEQLKQKRIQKMQKNAAIQRDERKKKMQKEKEKVEQLKQSDPENYLRGLYERRKEILNRIQERVRQKEEYSKRGSKAAQKRMQMIAELGIDDNDGRKKYKVAGQEQVEDNQDTFGMADEDWDVYRGIRKDGYSEDEEEDQQALAELEDQIADIDPKFTNSLFHTNSMPTAEDFQIRLWSERYKGTEILFQPSIVGLENAGLSEILENIMGQMDQKQKQVLMKYVLLTGGNTMVPGFDRRIKAELTMLNPQGTEINVVRAFDPQLDAWRGGVWLARNFMKGPGLQDFSVSRAQYEECGHHYLKEHFCSNNLYGQNPEMNQMANECPPQKRVKLH